MSQFKVGDKVVRGCGNYHGEVLNVLPPEMMINGELKPVAKGKRLVIAAHNKATGRVSITARCIDGTIDGNRNPTYTYRKVRPTITTMGVWVFVYRRLQHPHREVVGAYDLVYTTTVEEDARLMRTHPCYLIVSETHIAPKTLELPEGVELQ